MIDEEKEVVEMIPNEEAQDMIHNEGEAEEMIHN